MISAVQVRRFQRGLSESPWAITVMGVACFTARARPEFHSVTTFESVLVVVARTEMSVRG
jgi:hypothetical protein